MAIAPLRYLDLNTPESWYKLIAEPNTTVEDAIATHDRCWKNVNPTDLHLTMIPFLWNQFDDIRWRRLVTKNLLHHVDAYSNMFREDAGGLPLYASMFYTPLSICREFLDDNDLLQMVSSAAQGFVGVMKNVIDNKAVRGNGANWCKLGVPHLMSDTEVVDTLLLVKNWGTLPVLSLSSLSRIFQALEKDSRFTPFSTNDLELCRALTSLESETTIETHIVAPLNDPNTKDAASDKFTVILEQAAGNRYFQALVFHFFNARILQEISGKNFTKLLDYRKNNQHLLSGDAGLHTLSVMELGTESSFAPDWIRTFAATSSDGQYFHKADIWARFFPEWSKNIETWKALGLNHAEMVEACRIHPQSPKTAHNIDLPGDMDTPKG